MYQIREENFISDGSGIVVSDGQCMMIVDKGRVTEFCAEPGLYTYSVEDAPTFFSGSFGEGIRNTFAMMATRFAYGGEAAQDQRVYYFNTKEIMDNKFGTPNPVPFRVVDARIGLDVDVSLRCNGVYSYRLADPLLFYTNVCGNVSQAYRRGDIDAQLKTEFISALQPALARLSAQGVRPSEIPGHTAELEAALNEALCEKWRELRGIVVVNIAIGSVTLPDADREMITQAQRAAMYRDPGMAAATIVGAQADAMRAAAGNANGAVGGFMGMGMAMNAGGMNAQNLFAMGSAGAGVWVCGCGAKATGRFCSECGKPRP